MIEVYRINRKNGNFKDDYVTYVSDKRIVDYINEKGGYNITELPNWYETTHDWRPLDTKYIFGDMLEVEEVYPVEFPIILLGETDYFENF